MSTNRFAYCLLSIMLTAAHAPSVSADPAVKTTLAIVAAKNFPVDDLSFSDLKRLYMGDPIDAHGKRVIPLALPNRSPERTAFDETVLGMSPDAAARYWVDRKIRGESGPPKSIDSPQILLRVVDKLEGSLGYVRADAIPSNVKILRIDGRQPTDSGYRLSR